MSLHNRISKWIVRIKLNWRSKHLGYCTLEKEAGAKYNEAALDLFGEHALLNEISSDEEEEDEDEEDDVYEEDEDELV